MRKKRSPLPNKIDRPGPTNCRESKKLNFGQHLFHLKIVFRLYFINYYFFLEKYTRLFSTLVVTVGALIRPTLGGKFEFFVPHLERKNYQPHYADCNFCERGFYKGEVARRRFNLIKYLIKYVLILSYQRLLVDPFYLNFVFLRLKPLGFCIHCAYLTMPSFPLHLEGAPRIFCNSALFRIARTNCFQAFCFAPCTLCSF